MGSASQSLRTGVNALLDVVFPPTCAGCGASIDQPKAFCEACREDLLLFTDPGCPRCATPLLAAMPGESPDCPACRGERWAFDRVLALGPYEGLLRRLVLDTKRSAGEPCAAAFGRMLAHEHAEPMAAVDLVVPIPQHWTRRIGRRADGVAALASSLAAAADLPGRKALHRHRATPHQTAVAPSQRAANVRGAFSVVRPGQIAGRTIALVDDVFTTGATCHAAAQTLRRAGAGRVVAVVAARRIGAW